LKCFTLKQSVSNPSPN